MIQLILVALLVAGATGLGGFVYGVDVGKDKATVAQKKIEDVAAAAAKAVALSDAQMLAKITVTNKTIYQKATHEITKDPVYIDCKHSDSVLQLTNDALLGRTITVRDRKLPGPDGTGGQPVRNDGPEADRRGGAVLPVPASGGDSATK